MDLDRNVLGTTGFVVWSMSSLRVTHSALPLSSKNSHPLTSGLFIGNKSRFKSLTHTPRDGKEPEYSCSLRELREEREEKSDSFWNKTLSLTTPTWGKGKLRATWVGEQTEKCLFGTWKQAIWSQGPRDKSLRTKLCWGWGWGSGGNEQCRFQSFPRPTLSPGASVSCHCKQTAWGRLPGEMTRVFVSWRSFHQSDWVGPWKVSFLTWISDMLASNFWKPNAGTGWGSNGEGLRELLKFTWQSSFPGVLAKHFRKLSQ